MQDQSQQFIGVFAGRFRTSSRIPSWKLKMPAIPNCFRWSNLPIRPKICKIQVGGISSFLRNNWFHHSMLGPFFVFLNQGVWRSLLQHHKTWNFWQSNLREVHRVRKVQPFFLQRETFWSWVPTADLILRHNRDQRGCLQFCGRVCEVCLCHLCIFQNFGQK